jgi:hypothetical protein
VLTKQGKAVSVGIKPIEAPGVPIEVQLTQGPLEYSCLFMIGALYLSKPRRGQQMAQCTISIALKVVVTSYLALGGIE